MECLRTIIAATAKGETAMRFSDWTLDALIEYLTGMKSAPSDRLDYHCVTRVHGEIFVENGERKDGEEENCSWLS